MSAGDETVSFSLELNVEQGMENSRKLLMVASRALSVMERTGLLPEEAQKTIAQLRRAVALLNQIRLMMLAIRSAEGPIGWAIAGVSVAEVAVSSADYFEYDSRG